MRVGISTSVIQRGQTGIARYVFSLVKAFMAHEDQVQLFLFVLEEDRSLFTFTGHSAKIIPVPERIRPPGQDIWWHQKTLPRLARQHRLDVLHVPSYRRMLWRQPCPLVATIHDLAPFHVRGKYDWKRMLYARLAARSLAHRQQEIIAISQSTAHDIQKFFRVPPERITVIYNGIDHDRFFPPSNRMAHRDAVARRHSFQSPFFLYVARLEHPGKNHVRLIEAFNRFKSKQASPWRLVFAGSDWTGASVIHAAIKASPFSSDIHSLGFVPDAELPDLYRAADVFVYPSLFEGFGLPPIEAMACGAPVLCSPRGSLGEVVGEAALTVDPENTDALATALMRISLDVDLRERLAKAGVIQSQKFRWDTCARATLEVYSRAFEGREIL